jgi:hypothetical protein
MDRGQTDRWTEDIQTDRQANGLIDRQKDSHKDRWMDKQTDIQVGEGRQIDRRHRYRQTDGCTDRQMDGGQRDRWTEDIQTDRQMDRQTYT